MWQRTQQFIEAYVLATIDLGNRFEQFVLLFFGQREALVRSARDDRNDGTLLKRDAFDGNLAVNNGSSGNLHAIDGTPRFTMRRTKDAELAFWRHRL